MAAKEPLTILGDMGELARSSEVPKSGFLRVSVVEDSVKLRNTAKKRQTKRHIRKRETSEGRLGTARKKTQHS